MGNRPASRDLCLRDANVIEQVRANEQGFVLGRVYQHRSAATLLGQDDGSLGALHLADDRGEVGAQVGKWADILTRSDAGTAGLIEVCTE